MAEMNEERPTPEELLEAITKEEMLAKKGQLKVFLGLAAGVGKTYAMLEEAQKLNQDGVDIVVGVVDTHGREETEALLEGLKMVPLRKIVYRDKEFFELDLDAVLALHPQVVLVDELAHTNIPGSKHAKRWQDVLELLDHGINVYTTLNVQHIESLNDIIRSVTDISVRETVPDHVVDQAASIRVVDLTPEELLKRLREGRVYFEEQSRAATLHFFQKDRLTALRELALRFAADKVDRDLRLMAVSEEKMFDWKPREKFLTAISVDPHSQKLIRITKRLSSSLDAPWIAVHVDDGSQYDDKEIEQLGRNFALARDLGAEVMTVNDPNIAHGLARIAKHKGVTQIILGRPVKSFIKQFIKGTTLIDQLTKECEEIDINIIREEKKPPTERGRLFFFRTWQGLPLILGLSALFALINWFSLPFIGYQMTGALFLLATLVFSFFFKRGPILISSLFFALIWIFFFIPPPYTFKVEYQSDWPLIILYLIATLAISVLVSREKEHRDILAKSEESTRALYEMVNQIATAPSLDAILKFIKERFDRLLHGKVEFVIKDIENQIHFENSSLVKNSKEQNAALWSFSSGKEAGWSGENLPLAENLYIPLKGYHETVGLLIYHPLKKQALTGEEKNFIYTVCNQLANYLERSFAQEKSYQHESLVQMQKIQKMILDRFSHAFQSPLEVIQSGVNTLKDFLQREGSTPFFHEFYQLETSLEVLTKNLNNIATMTELTEGMTPLKKTLQPVEEIMQDCFPEPQDHKMKVVVEEKLPPISCDVYLIQILLNHLLINALEYSPRGTLVTVEAKRAGDYLCISVSDEGPGIPEEHLNTIFDKFYRLPHEPLPRIGLGLAISKTIAELHNGYMKAENRPSGGARFSLFLPY